MVTDKTLSTVFGSARYSEPRTKEKRGGFAYFTRYFSGTFHISSISASVFPWSFNFRLLQISAFSEQTWQHYK
jgi:hypothetical protein